MPHISGRRRLGAKLFACALAAASLTAALAGPAVARTGRTAVPMPVDHAVGAAEGADDDPLFAYYYIWFSQNSWARAKKDLPLIGTYSSSDPGVMRHQIEQANRRASRASSSAGRTPRLMTSGSSC